MARKYSLLILKSSAQTRLGEALVLHICTFLPDKLKWAVVRTSNTECDTSRFELGDQRPALTSKTREIIISSYSEEELDSLDKSTKIFITILQPTETEHDRTIVKACARNGTHYIDAKSNETFHLRDLIQEYEYIAKETGSIVCRGSALGFEADEGKLLSHISDASAPRDLLTFSAVSELRMKLSL